MTIKEKSSGAALELVATVRAAADDGSEALTLWCRPAGAGASGELRPYRPDELEQEGEA